MTGGSFGFRKIVKKSERWHFHGKHAKVDPRLVANDQRRRPALMRWFSNIRELFLREARRP